MKELNFRYWFYFDVLSDYNLKDILKHLENILVTSDYVSDYFKISLVDYSTNKFSIINFKKIDEADIAMIGNEHLMTNYLNELFYPYVKVTNFLMCYTDNFEDSI